MNKIEVKFIDKNNIIFNTHNIILYELREI